MEATAIEVFTAGGVLLANVWLWILNGKFERLVDLALRSGSSARSSRGAENSPPGSDNGFFGKPDRVSVSGGFRPES